VYFTHLKCQKPIGDDVGDIHFYQKNLTKKMKMTGLIHFIKLIMQEYDSKCLKMYLITLKVFKICSKMFVLITKVNEGESNTPCPSTLEVTYSSVEKLSKALHLQLGAYQVYFYLHPRGSWYLNIDLTLRA
jgi:hypothetical protein